MHVNQVKLGNLKGPATSPVKVYADKFMIQMEDESSNKEISFRVPCKDIMSLNVGRKIRKLTQFLNIINPTLFLIVLYIVIHSTLRDT